jgi:ribosomal protein L11 methyltransferase
MTQTLDASVPLSDPRLAPDTTIASLQTDEQTARRMADLFAEGFGDDVAVGMADAGQGHWRVTLYFHRTVDEATVRDQAAIVGGAAIATALRFERITAKDWVAESLVGLKPVAAGRFIVHGAHDRAGIPPNRIGIEIEAALAFGTGHHGTTRGCLLALDRLCKSLRGGKAVSRVLDLGTGSGVLAIAAARALHRRVLATDIDAAAVHVARANARLNRVGPLVTLATAAGVTAPAIRSQAPFDLVFANILLEPLQRLAAPLGKIVAPGGRVVVSGLLTAQANAARAAYHAFRLERWIALDGWTTLVLRRSGQCSTARRGGFEPAPTRHRARTARAAALPAAAAIHRLRDHV